MPIRNVTGKAANLPLTLDSANEDCVRICGESIPQGLANEGRVSFIPVTDASWTKIALLTPTAAPLAVRRAASIQNTDGFGTDNPASILINYASDSPFPPQTLPPAVAKGIVIRSGEERFYDVNDQVFFWVRVVAGGGSFDITFEEIA